MQLVNPPVTIVDDDTFASASATTVPSSESTKAYVDAQSAGSLTVEDETGSSYTVDVTDNGKVKRFTDAGLVTVTLPDGIAAGTIVELLSWGAGGLAIQDDGSSTVQLEGTIAQYESCCAVVVDTDTWSVVGPIQ